ncbi:MAG TPA: PPOX class F420-dependent oxidoreductase [Solirubrobacteraceae bacterium]|jgi:PPOX class probable F420-dependent enzyme|nr:PPOX class F420-dependent oxidoreductase [Solirubrobacteraceae bacterium]
MSLGQRLVQLSDRAYDRLRHRDAFTAARAGAGIHGFGALRGRKYCLLVTYRRSGEPVPTPVWFGLDGDRALFVRTESDAGKVKRIRRDPRVLVGPASARGKPTGPLAEGSARVLEGEEEDRAESALRANYGLGRKLYEGMSGPLGVEAVYLEVTPA